MRIPPYCFQGLCFYLRIFVLHLYTFYQYTYLLLVFLSDLSTVVSFLSIYFANSDLGLMVLMLANSVFEGVGFLFLPSRTLLGVLVFL